MNKIFFIVTLIFVVAGMSPAQDDYHKVEVSGGYSFERTKGFPGDTFSGTISSGATSTTSTTGTNRDHNLNGFNASAVYNFSRYFGAKFDVSGHFGSDTNHILPGGVYRRSGGTGTILIIPDEIGIKASQRDYKFLGGLQFKDNSKNTKLKPFAHALFGTARQTTRFPGLDQQRVNLIGGNNSIKSSGFSMALGGGLDVRVSKHIDIRVVQFDYNPVYVKEKTLVDLGAQIDSLVTGTGGSVVTTLQDLRVPKHTQQNFRIGFGIVFH